MGSCGEEGSPPQESEFYKKAQHYWAGVSPTVDGVLGGFAFISQPDIKGSQHFLHSLFDRVEGPGRERALDCGAGIGRVTKELLAKNFDVVDLVEQDPHFIEAASAFVQSPKLDKLYCSGLQDFVPECKYDVIWCQWVLGHLTDADFVRFFEKCRECLKSNGVIVVKENVTSSGQTEVDETDSSVTRPLKLLNQLFYKAGLKQLTATKQNGFPKGLYPVHMFALVPSQL